MSTLTTAKRETTLANVAMAVNYHLLPLYASPYRRCHLKRDFACAQIVKRPPKNILIAIADPLTNGSVPTQGTTQETTY